MLKIALSHFFLKLAVGLLPWLTLIPIQDTGEGFFRLLVFLSLSSSLLGLLLHYFYSDPEYWLWVALIVSLFISFLAIRRFQSRINLLILPSFILGCSVLAGQDFNGYNGSSFYLFLNFLLGSLLMGSALFAMVLGHWYLIRSKLPFYFLIRSVLVFFALALLRTGFILYTLFFEKPGNFPYLFVHVGGVLFFTRFLWGILLPVIFLVPAYRCAKIHSNRSATGILYFTTGAIFMGELMADFLSMISGVPL